MFLPLSIVLSVAGAPKPDVSLAATKEFFAALEARDVPRLGSDKQTKHNFSEPTGGDYSFKLAKTDGVWRLTAITFKMTWEQGTR